jgi:hypothetical protein
MGNRPGIDNRPSNRPDVGNRPGIGNRPGLGDRTNVGSGNIVGSGNNVIGSGNTRNTQVNVNRPTVNAVANNPFSGYGGYGGYGWSTPYRSYYSGWHKGNWSWYQPAVGAAVGTALGWLAGASAGYTYSNPYYVEPAVEAPAALNYSEPIVIQAPPTEAPPPAEVNITLSEETTATPMLTPPPPPPEQPTEKPTEKPAEDPAVREAMAKLDEARAAFAKGEYARTQELIEKRIQKLPGDATLHEFRAVTQSAQKNYKDAAGTV